MQKFLKHIFGTVRRGAIIISHKYPLKGFNSILKEEYKLSHKNGMQEICSFFYKKIWWSREDFSEEIYLTAIIQQIILSFITLKNIIINKIKLNKYIILKIE